MGRLLLDNAALVNRNAPPWEVPPDKFSDVIDVNIKGVTGVARHFVPAPMRLNHLILLRRSFSPSPPPRMRSGGGWEKTPCYSAVPRQIGCSTGLF